jgi:hypothetical protein
MTPSGQHKVPTFQRELDPFLLLPVRLFMVCLLADGRWCKNVAIREALRLTQQTFAPHVEHLHAAGYLAIHTEGRRTKLRLTAVGLDRLTDHVAALQFVVRTAAELVAAQRCTPANDGVTDC